MSLLTSQETITTLSVAGQTKAALPFSKSLLLAFLAGAYIALGAHLCTTVTTGISPLVGYGLTKLIGGMSFSLGLILVVIAGAELFTGNTLMVSSVLTRKITLAALFKNWVIIWCGNLFGALAVATLIYFSGVNGTVTAPSAIGQTALATAQAKAGLSIVQIIVRGMLANWLVCLAIYLATTTSTFSGKMMGIMFPITAFVAMGFEHSVANMYFLTAGRFLSPSLSFGSLANNLLYATLGNIVGSVTFVVFPYWYVHLRKN